MTNQFAIVFNQAVSNNIKKVLYMINILAADIGGTNSRFAHFTSDDNGRLTLVNTIWFRTGEVSSFKELISGLNRESFSILPERADVTVIAIAGPVERGVYSAPP